jgi:hypothetical protein
MSIGPIGCTKRKLDRPYIASESSTASALFCTSRAYCEHCYDAWHILSAKHGLIHPDAAIAERDRSSPTLQASMENLFTTPKILLQEQDR